MPISEMLIGEPLTAALILLRQKSPTFNSFNTTEAPLPIPLAVLYIRLYESLSGLKPILFPASGDSTISLAPVSARNLTSTPFALA